MNRRCFILKDPSFETTREAAKKTVYSFRIKVPYYVFQVENETALKIIRIKISMNCFASCEVSDFSMQIHHSGSPNENRNQFQKTIRKNIDGSLKSFCGGSGISDHGYPKRFFSAGTTEYICYRKSDSLTGNKAIENSDRCQMKYLPAAAKARGLVK